MNCIYEYKTKKGVRYYVSFSFDGKRVFKRGFVSHELAKKFIESYNEEYSFNLSCLTFYDLIDNYLLFNKNNYSLTTYHNKFLRYNKYFKKLIPNKLVLTLCFRDFLSWYNVIDKLQYSYNLKTKIRNDLISLFDYCEKIYSYRCVYAYRLPKFKNNDFYSLNNFKHKNFISFGEFSLLINSISNEDHFFKLFLLVMFYSGCRLGEVRALNYQSFNDLKHNNIFIFRNCTSKVGLKQNILINPKTKNSLRVVFVPDFLKILLLDYISNKQQWCYCFSLDGGSNPVSETTLNRLLRSYEQKCSFDFHLHFHLFRHSLATILSSKMLNENYIKNYLGHSSFNVTSRYVHVDVQEKNDILNVLNNIKN